MPDDTAKPDDSLPEELQGCADAEPRPDRRPFQFTLRTLMEWTTALCLLLGLLNWGGEALSRTPEAFLGLGICLLLAGLWLRRWPIITCGVLLLLGLLVGLGYTIKPPPS